MSTLITIFENKHYTNKVCLEPFGTVEITANGFVRLCGCASWMPVIVGNIFDNTIDEILNSKLAIDIRNSIRDGSFRYCNEKSCGIILNNQLLDKSEYNPEADYRWRLYENESELKNVKTYFVAGDTTCNLSCPSCRTSVIKNTPETMEHFNKLSEAFSHNLLNSYNNEIFEIRMSTSGEIFASPMLMNFLINFPIDQYPKVRFWFQTNGLLVKQRWSRIEKISNNVKNITVTTDSCTKKNYEKLRRGGIFEDLLENLEFISTLNIKFNIRMVVQQDNQSEIIDFYNWAKSVGASEVEYVRLTNWGTFTDEEFRNLDVLDVNHPLYENTVQQLKYLKERNNDVFIGGVNI